MRIFFSASSFWWSLIDRREMGKEELERHLIIRTVFVRTLMTFMEVLNINGVNNKT